MLQRKYLNGVTILSIDKQRVIKSLKKIARRIKREHSEVIDIIVFGSFSENNFVPFSDVDIAIIVKATDKNFIIRQDDFIDYFLDLPIDTNLVVYSRDEIEKLSSTGNHFIKGIEKGKRL